MNTILTIVIGFAVLIATLLFLSCSVCAVTGGISGQERTISTVIALVSLGAIIGGVSLIARINRSKEPPE